jgi:hypothetical protein
MAQKELSRASNAVPVARALKMKPAIWLPDHSRQTLCDALLAELGRMVSRSSSAAAIITVPNSLELRLDDDEAGALKVFAQQSFREASNDLDPELD